MKSNKATIDEIAKKLGISKMTVSRAINHPERVGKQTLERVMQMMDEMDYKPQLVARVMAGSESRTIGFFIKPNKDFIIPPFYGECVKGATEWLKMLDYSTLIFNASEERSKKLFVDYVNSNLIDGAVVFEGSYDETLLKALKNNNIPAVCVGEENSGEYDIPTISANNYEGSRTAVTHLVQKGCRRITHITGMGEKPSYELRIRGYEEVLRENGLRSNIIKTENTVEGGIEGFEMLLKSGEPFDGIFCFSDLVAWGVLKRIYQTGLRVPEDVKVMGFDNIPVAEYTTPSLSTVSQNMREMSKFAVGMLIQIIGGKTPEKEHLKFNTDLVIRESTNKSPERG